MSVFRKQTSRKGNVMYEEVLQKNFQVIETFLKKFHQIFTKQDQFEQQLNKFTEKFTDYDQNLEELRQDQKMSFIMLEKKITNMKSSGRQSHRSSHRFSKANIPIFGYIESHDSNNSIFQSKKDYTSLKFDSIETENPQNIDGKILKKELQNPGVSTKQLEEVKETVESIKEELTEMKDKIHFLSVYTSQISMQEKKSKNDLFKKEIAQSLENHLKTKIEKDIQLQIIETEKIFLQQINNLQMRISEEITCNIDEKYEQISSEIQKLEETFFTHEKAQIIKQSLESEIKKFTNECIQIFSNKQETKRSVNLINRKVKIIENSLKESMNKSGEEKQLIEGFRSTFHVNSTANQQTTSKISSLHKQRKSHSQVIKNKNFSKSINFGDEEKENTLKNRKTCRKGHQLSQGSLFTSKVSKEFMKNFGLNQRKLIKTTCLPKRQKNWIDSQQGEEKTTKPQNLIRQSMESC